MRYTFRAKTALAVIISVLALAFVSACASSGDRDFWGNPIVTTPADGCDVAQAAPPAETRKQAVPAAAPGQLIADFKVVLNALTIGDDGHLCIDKPYAGQWDTHLYGTANGRNVFVSPDAGPLPYDTVLTSPNTFHLYLRYPVGQPLVVMLDFSVKHIQSGLGGVLPDHGAAAGCYIQYGGTGPNGGDGNFATIAQDTVHKMKGGDYLRCQVEFPLA